MNNRFSHSSFCLLTVLLLTGGLSACGGEEKSNPAKQDGGGSSGTQEKDRVAYGGVVKFTVTGGKNVAGTHEYTLNSTVGRATDSFGRDASAGGRCRIERPVEVAEGVVLPRAYSVFASDGRQYFGLFMLSQNGEFRGPGSYETNADWNGVWTSSCGLMVFGDERSGSFSCPCQEKCEGTIFDPSLVRALEGTFQCSQEFEEFD